MISSYIKRTAVWLGILILVSSGGLLTYGTWVLLASRPKLEGTFNIPGLSAPVQITRDAQGVPTIVAVNRLDLARALGFLHGQERFFEMDLLRRSGAGELSALLGPAALTEDRQYRLHRFRSRAKQALIEQSSTQHNLLSAYAAGVNAGLAALGHLPWEYSLLNASPEPWSELDSALVVYSMYFTLQDRDAYTQLQSAAIRAVLGPTMADFLLQSGSPYDAPVDGSVLSRPPFPASLPAAEVGGSARLAPPKPGSNSFAVAGRLTANGAAMVANDMHLPIAVPNTWYRARMVIRGGTGADTDLVGVTLPGFPTLVIGSNTYVAWGCTNSYIESGDAVVVDMLPGEPRNYLTIAGPKPLKSFVEHICTEVAGQIRTCR